MSVNFVTAKQPQQHPQPRNLGVARNHEHQPRDEVEQQREEGEA
jgi:hypothetical protein